MVFQARRQLYGCQDVKFLSSGNTCSMQMNGRARQQRGGRAVVKDSAGGESQADRAKRGSPRHMHLVTTSLAVPHYLPYVNDVLLSIDPVVTMLAVPIDHTALPKAQRLQSQETVVLPEARNDNDSELGGEACNHSHFMAFPRELRDLVYDSLLDEERVPPEDPEHAGDRRPNSPAAPCTIFFEAKIPKPALLQLKLCNHQIHAEVLDTLRKKFTKHTTPSRLDIMIQGSSIWPTWTFLPLTSTLDPVINISLRIFESTGRGSEFSTGAYRALWALFNRLVFRGPCLINDRNIARPLAIGRLRFEIILCYPTTVDDLFGTYRDVFERVERLAYDNVGLGNVDTIEACLGADRRVWRLRQLPTGLTFASRV